MKESLNEVKRERLSFGNVNGAPRFDGVVHIGDTFAAHGLAADFLEGIAHTGSTLGEGVIQMFVTDSVTNTNDHITNCNANHSH